MSFLVTKRKSLSDDAPAEWKNILTTLLQNGESLEDFDNYSNCLKSITTEDIRKGFEDYVRPERVALLYKGNPF
jgi:zinc protease